MRKHLRLVLLATALCGSTGAWAQFDAGNYYLKNVESGKYLAGGNSWGTQASLIEHGEHVTLALLPEGTFTLESRVSNGGTKHYLGPDGFMDNDTPVSLTFTAVGEYYTMSVADAYYGYDGQSIVLARNLTADAPGALWQVISEADMKASLATATKDVPVDATFLIKDHNFSRNHRDASAWTLTNGNLSGGDLPNHCAEAWQTTFTLTQDLGEVPNGVYALTAQGFYRVESGSAGSLPVFYANEATAPFFLRTGTENSMGEASASFSAGMYTIDPIYVEVTDGKLVVGAKSESSNLWQIWDHFTLKYYGNVSIIDFMPKEYFVEQYNEALSKAEAVEEQDMSVEHKALFNEKLESAKVDVETATNSEMNEAAIAFDALVVEGQEYVVIYANAQKAAELMANGNSDFTSLITNPGFNNSQTGWTNVACGNAANNGNFTIGTGAFTEKWTPSNGQLEDGSLTQVIPGLPAGVYTLSAMMQNLQQGDETIKTGGFFLTLNGSQTEVSAASAYSTTIVLAAGEDLTVGVKLEGCTGNWICVDEFQLTYAADADAAVVAASDKYDASKTMGADVKLLFTSAMEMPETTDDEKFAKINAVTTAVRNAYASAAAYENMKTVLDGYASKLLSRPALTTKEFTSITDGQTAYTNGTYTIAQANDKSVNVMNDYRAYLREIEAGFMNANIYVANGNVDFETDNSGWMSTNEGLSSDKAQNINDAQKSGDISDAKLYENWSSSGTMAAGNMYTTVNNLPAGKYVLRMAAQYNGGNEESYIYAKTSENTVTAPLYSYTEVPYIHMTDPITVEEGQSLEIGFHYAGGKAWAAIDAVRLYAYSIDDQTAANAEADIQYGTICLPYAATTDAPLYTVGIAKDGTKVDLTLVEDGKLEAGVAYIYGGNEATFEYAPEVDWKAPIESTLTGMLSEQLVPVGKYVLQAIDGHRAFYRVAEGKQPTASAFRAFLTVPEASGVRNIIEFGDEMATALEAVEALQNGTAEIYNLNGQKLQKLQKGVNIVNGTKIIVK